jgi:glycosyltransferase involved in cell wall biosynthesis
MRLLISAYACAPHRGSETGVGWSWATEAMRQGHQVWVFTSPVYRQAIEAACRRDATLQPINWVFPEVPGWKLQQEREPRFERSYDLLWQYMAFRMARRLHGSVRFDAVHHLTWGGIRAHTFMGRLGVPLIVGPIGGGETSPLPLRACLTAKARLTEFIRDASNATIAFNPLIRAALDRAAIIVARTVDTRKVLPAAWQRKSHVFSELTLQPADIGQPRAAPSRPPRLLCVGRLLYWKGVHIALQALADVVARHPGARLTILGDGPESARLHQEASARGLAAHVDFLPWIPREDVRTLYELHDLLLFPSLHDSGGTVMLEALSRGLPVICLDIGGPAAHVTPDCGIVLPTADHDTARLARRMAEEICGLMADPVRYAALSRGAIARARDFSISDRIAAFYRICAGALDAASHQSEPQGHRPARLSTAAGPQ